MVEMWVVTRVAGALKIKSLGLTVLGSDGPFPVVKTVEVENLLANGLLEKLTPPQIRQHLRNKAKRVLRPESFPKFENVPVPIPPPPSSVITQRIERIDLIPKEMTREEKIVVIIQDMIRDGKDLTTGGKPEVWALSHLVGFKVSARERDDLFAKVMMK